MQQKHDYNSSNKSLLYVINVTLFIMNMACEIETKVLLKCLVV